MADFEVLMPGQGMPMISEQIGARTTLHRMWLAPDAEAFVSKIAPNVRGIAAAGAHAPIDAAFIDRFPKLEIISGFGVGYDHIDARHADKRGIVVTHTRGVLDDEVADLAMGLTLATVRRLPQSERYLRAGQWRAKGNYPLTTSLRGRKMGIFGLGRIGKAIAQRAEAFGVEVVYCGRSAQPGVPYLYYPSLRGMAAACDILLLIAPGGAATRKIVDAEVLEALGPDGFLINVARGTLVDDDALIAALEAGKIAGAGLDVFTDEPNVPAALMERDDVVLLPHLGSATHKTRSDMAQLVVDNILHWIDGKGPLTPVPETPWPKPA